MTYQLSNRSCLAQTRSARISKLERGFFFVLNASGLDITTQSIVQPTRAVRQSGPWQRARDVINHVDIHAQRLSGIEFIQWNMLFPLMLALAGSAWASTLRGVMPGLDAIDLQSTAFALRDLQTSHFTRHYVTSKGEFEFYNLQKDAKYVLTLDSDTLEMPWSYLVLPQDTGIAVHRVADGQPLSATSPTVAHPIEVTGYKRSELVVDRPVFSVLGFIKQPTVLLAVAALVVVTYLPTLLNSIDPELLEELKKNELKPGGSADKVQGFDLAKSIADRRVKGDQ